MHIVKKLKLSGMMELVTSELYQEDAIDGIKEELEALHGVKLQKSLYDNYLKLQCIHKGTNLCPYAITFRIEFRANRRNHQILLLESFVTEHTALCRNAQQAQFLKNRHLLNQNQPALIKLVQKRTSQGQPLKNPTQILQIFCQQQKLNRNFLYQGLESGELKRKMKKKFDNIVAEVRRRCREGPFLKDGQVFPPDLQTQDKRGDENLDGNGYDSRMEDSSSEKKKICGVWVQRAHTRAQ